MAQEMMECAGFQTAFIKTNAILSISDVHCKKKKKKVTYVNTLALPSRAPRTCILSSVYTLKVKGRKLGCNSWLQAAVLCSV